MARISRNLSPERTEQLLRERGITPLPPKNSTLVQRTSRHDRLAELAHYDSPEAIDARIREKYKDLPPVEIPVYTCPDCQGAGCGIKAVPKGTLYCLNGTLVDHGELSNLRNMAILSGKPERWTEIMLPLCLKFKNVLDLDLRNATVGQHTPVLPGSDRGDHPRTAG